MTQEKKQWPAIIIMIALFAMIAFVTNLCTPMAVIVKNQFGASNFLAQIGNYGNFIAYLVMGVPSGMLVKRYGYKKTALLALIVGIIGIFIQWVSGWDSVPFNFAIYLVGAFIAGFCMCMLNTVVNPMLNLLGGGGNKGNQLIQIGGVFNSSAAVACYILMGALIGEAAKAKISDATPALFIAMGIFIVAFIIILFTKIHEPEQPTEYKKKVEKDPHSAFSFRHFNLGILGIFLYMGIEVGVPNYVMQFLTADTPDIIAKKEAVMKEYESGNQNTPEATLNVATKLVAVTTNIDSIKALNNPEDIKSLNKQISDTQAKIQNHVITSASINKTVPGRGMSTGIVGLIVAIYWLMMLVGRLIGGTIGGKVSSRSMIAFVAIACLILVLFGMYAPESSTVSVWGINWSNLSMQKAQVPIGIFAFLLVGLCTSVMWGGIFNMAVEGLGKYTSIASGTFMTMVFGCAVMQAIQGAIADASRNYLTSYWVVVFCAAYILFYALIGSKNVNKDIITE